MSAPRQKTTDGFIPVPHNWGEAQLFCDNETYKIEDLFMKDSKGRIVWTISLTVLYPQRQTKGHVNEGNVYEEYYFTEGDALLMLDSVGVNVTAGDYILIEPTVWHKVINLKQLPVSFMTRQPGRMKHTAQD